MEKLSRFGVSMENELLGLFDAYIKEKNYKNRSEAIRDLIRHSFVKEEWRNNERVAGALLLVYDHHMRELVDKLLDIQHDFQALIVSVQHIHLDHSHCLEIIVVKGRAGDIRKLHDRLQALKGVKHAALSMTTTGKKIG